MPLPLPHLPLTMRGNLMQIGLHNMLAIILVPFLALLDGLLLYKRNPALLRYWYALPGITLARLAWYVGLTFGTDRSFLSENSTS